TGERARRRRVGSGAPRGRRLARTRSCPPGGIDTAARRARAEIRVRAPRAARTRYRGPDPRLRHLHSPEPSWRPVPARPRAPPRGPVRAVSQDRGVPRGLSVGARALRLRARAVRGGCGPGGPGVRTLILSEALRPRRRGDTSI